MEPTRKDASIVRKRLDELSIEQKRLLTSPYGFGKYYLGLPISDTAPSVKVGECRDGTTGELYYEVNATDAQRRALELIDASQKTSVRTGNGCGKTSIIIPSAVLWFMALHPRAKVVITSGVERQVRGQVFPALRGCERSLGGWDFTDTQITAPNGSVAVGFSTNEGGRFEGWHGNKDPFYDLMQHDGPLMVVVDEAKSIKQTIYDAIDRCTIQKLVLASSCGGSSGEFYASHTKNAKYWGTAKIAAADCPYVDHKKNAELIARRGIADALVRSKVFAEFMEGAEGACIQRPWVERTIANPPAFQPGSTWYHCDFAAGGDENTIAERQGNRVRLVAAWREKDTMRGCGQFIDHFRKLGLGQDAVARMVSGDEGGLGKVMLDRLKEIGWQLQRRNNGSAANDDTIYKNRGAEVWFEAAKKFEFGRVILDGADDVTISQLTERQGFTPSNGKREIETKEDMRARGIDSPDRADAIVETLWDGPSTQAQQFMGRATDEGERLDALLRAVNGGGFVEIPELEGANAG
jgi:phage terminase large subunit